MRRTTFLLISAFFIVSGRLCLGVECSDCAKVAQQMTGQENQKQNLQGYLKTNTDYMQNNPSMPSSAKVKVQSNIVQARILMETADNNITFLKQDLDKRGCLKCATTKEN